MTYDTPPGHGLPAAPPSPFGRPASTDWPGSPADQTHTPAAPPVPTVPNQTPPQPPSIPVEQTGDALDPAQLIQWDVVGWTDTNPFRGALTFFDGYGNPLIEIPVDPEAMANLHDLTGAVIAAQYAAFGAVPEGQDPGPDVEPQPGKRKKHEVDPANLKTVSLGSINMTINKPVAKMLGALAITMIVLAALLSIL